MTLDINCDLELSMMNLAEWRRNLKRHSRGKIYDRNSFKILAIDNKLYFL